MNGDLNFLALSIDALFDCERSEIARTMLTDMSKSIDSAISRESKMTAEIEQLRAELEHEIQRSEFYKGEFLCRKGNSVALEKFDKFKAEIKADAIISAIADTRDAAEMYDRSGVVSFCTVDDLKEYAEKVRRGEV